MGGEVVAFGKRFCRVGERRWWWGRGEVEGGVDVELAECVWPGGLLLGLREGGGCGERGGERRSWCV